MIDKSNCLLTHKRLSPQGNYVATLTCFRCGHSTEINFGGWSAVTCMHCNMLLERGEYLTNRKLEDCLASIDKQMDEMKICVSNTAAAGFSIYGPFFSYRTLVKKRSIISRVKNNPNLR